MPLLEGLSRLLELLSNCFNVTLGEKLQVCGARLSVSVVGVVVDVKLALRVGPPDQLR